MEKFGEFLKKARKKSKLTLRAVEEKTGISNSYLSQIEKGKRGVPSIGFLIRLGSVYDLPSGKLMESAVSSFLNKGVTFEFEQEGKESVPVLTDEIENIRKKYSELTPENRKQLNNFLLFLLDRQQKEFLGI